jgi:hypothetical protein|tara:strand:+ start:9034 stop:9627 length:594 start_codon:yes stop_codon:yes gene_type:complete
VAVDALGHFERLDLLHDIHGAHVAVAGGAHSGRRHPVLFGEERYVGFVNESNVVRLSVNAHPVDGIARFKRRAQFFNLSQSVADGHVTGHAQTDRRDGRSGALGDVPVAESAVESQVLNVPGVREGNRLARPLIVAEDDGLTNPSGYDERTDQYGRDETDQSTKAEKRKQCQFFAGRPSVLKISRYQILLILVLIDV